MGANAETTVQQTLWDEKDALLIIFDSAPVGITLAALDGTFLKANSAFQTMVGYSEEELCQRTGVDLTYGDEDRVRTPAA
jgi:PAS domain S-box-containing protein